MRAMLFLGLATLAIGGCDRTHMRPESYGQSVRRALKAQVIDPAAGDRPAREQGLDPEEAAIVSKSYRESLSPKHEEGSRTPLVVVPSNGPGGVPLTPGSLPTR